MAVHDADANSAVAAASQEGIQALAVARAAGSALMDTLGQASSSVQDFYTARAGGTCTLDAQGHHSGCRASCQCAWLEQCYPKFAVAVASGSGSGAETVPKELQRIDIGVCSTAVGVLVLVSFLLFSTFLGCVVGLRIMFQWRERITELRLRTEEALAFKAGMESEFDDETEAESVAAGVARCVGPPAEAASVGPPAATTDLPPPTTTEPALPPPTPPAPPAPPAPQPA